jgi:hypothetical protein
VIALISAKHRGVTTAALALATAAVLEGQRALLLEADPDGGELAALLGRSLDPGLLSLAACPRQDLSAGAVDRHVQRLGSGVGALFVPLSPIQATAALLELSRYGPSALGAWEGVCVADCGRWRSGSPSSWLVTVADTTLIVTHPTVAGVEHVRARYGELEGVAQRLAVLLIGERPYTAEEVGAATGLPIAGILPWDPRGVDALVSDRPGRGLGRTLVVRAARSVLNRMPEAAYAKTLEEARHDGS